MGTRQSAGSNPPAGGSGASPSLANSLAEGLTTPTPAQGAPAADAGSNPQAGGSSDPQAPTPDDKGPVSRSRYDEMARSEAILRKERTELRARLQALEDAQLSDVERKDQALVRAQEEVAEKTRLNQSLRLQIAIADKVRERNLVSAAAVQALLMNDFRQEIVDDPELETVAHLVDLLVEKYDFLQQQTPGTQPPASGRSMSPARAPTGQYAQKPVEPVPYSKFERLGDLTKEDWENAAKKSGQQ